MISDKVHFKDYYLKIAEEFVKPKIISLGNLYPYHNWKHTSEVTDAAYEIGQEEGLSEENFILSRDIKHIS